MTDEERIRIGRRLRAIRIDRGLKQSDVATDPILKLHVGTVQAIEGNLYPTRVGNIQKYCALFGTTIERLLADPQPPGEVPASHPLLRGLNSEHLEVAQHYMHAKRRVRTCVETLLSLPDPLEEILTTLVIKLGTLPPDKLASLDLIVTAMPDQIDLVVRTAQRLIADPQFAALAKEGLDVVDRLPTPTLVTKKLARTAPTRRRG